MSRRSSSSSHSGTATTRQESDAAIASQPVEEVERAVDFEDDVLYHRWCAKCCVCGVALTQDNLVRRTASEAPTPATAAPSSASSLSSSSSTSVTTGSPAGSAISDSTGVKIFCTTHAADASALIPYHREQQKNRARAPNYGHVRTASAPSVATSPRSSSPSERSSSPTASRVSDEAYTPSRPSPLSQSTPASAADAAAASAADVPRPVRGRAETTGVAKTVRGTSDTRGSNSGSPSSYLHLELPKLELPKVGKKRGSSSSLSAMLSPRSSLKSSTPRGKEPSSSSAPSSSSTPMPRPPPPPQFEADPLPPPPPRETVDSLPLHTQVGFAELQGHRPSMEDALVVGGQLGGDSRMDFYGLFDGHNGPHASYYAACHLFGILGKFIADSGGPGNADIAHCMRLAYREVHDDMVRAGVVSGSTAVVAVCVNNGDVFVANAGDSRAVLFRVGNNEVTRVTTDHKPHVASERKRIQASGGKVQRPMLFFGTARVDGVLAVSRALGDPYLWPTITCEPDVFQLHIPRQSGDILILGCDGIWDVIDDKEAAYHAGRGVVNARDNPGLDPELMITAESLCKQAIRKGSTDNCSAMIIRFV